ncbi:hypothetical protein BJF90_07345 [Pseudonocardia sp. CNS-004]|nr:hypothetical protein BJF90_07345 [Pseudonocardia sp. CNS-004]
MWDTRALTADVPADAARAYEQQVVAAGAAPRADTPWGRAVAGAAQSIGIAVCVVFALFFGLSIILSVLRGAYASAFGNVLVFAVLCAAGAVLVVRSARGRDSGSRWYRLAAFARTNGFAYAPVAEPPVAGVLVAHPQTGELTDLVIIPAPVHAHIANYTFRDLDFSDRSIRTSGYVATPLGTDRPHVLLRANRSRLSLPGRRWRRVDTGSRMPRGFALYTPPGTPRAMPLTYPCALATTLNSAPFPIEIAEIRGRWLLLGIREPVSTLDPDRWLRLQHFLPALRAVDENLT